jgi:hypothetical protein
MDLARVGEIEAQVAFIDVDLVDRKVTPRIVHLQIVVTDPDVGLLSRRTEERAVVLDESLRPLSVRADDNQLDSGLSSDSRIRIRGPSGAFWPIGAMIRSWPPIR